MAPLASNPKAALAPSPMMFAYLAFIGSAAGVVWLVAEGHFSSLLTVAGMLQCLAVWLLAIQTLITGTVTGVSAKALALDACALILRLSSTLWLNGYLPVDATGDFVYQAVDIISVLVIAWLLHQVLVVRRATYQEEADSFAVGHLVVMCLVGAALFHADMNYRPLFDAAWMAGLFISAAAVMPQLWLITKTGGRVEALTAHYIAAMALGRALSGLFMWHARFDITCTPWLPGLEHAIAAILIAHAFHLLCLGDFAYYYVRAIMTQGLFCRIELDNLSVDFV